jgi:hypothetical protein
MTLHRWRAEYRAVDRDAVTPLKQHEKENARLRRLWRMDGLQVPHECVKRRRVERQGEVVHIVVAWAASLDGQSDVPTGYSSDFH